MVDHAERHPESIEMRALKRDVLIVVILPDYTKQITQWWSSMTSSRDSLTPHGPPGRENGEN